MLLVIKGRGKIGYLTGATAAPSLNSVTYIVWEAENNCDGMVDKLDGAKDWTFVPVLPNNKRSARCDERDVPRP